MAGRSTWVGLLLMDPAVVLHAGAPRRDHRRRTDPDVRDGRGHPQLHPPDEGGRPVRALRVHHGQVRDGGSARDRALGRLVRQVHRRRVPRLLDRAVRLGRRVPRAVRPGGREHHAHRADAGRVLRATRPRGLPGATRATCRRPSACRWGSTPAPATSCRSHRS